MYMKKLFLFAMAFVLLGVSLFTMGGVKTQVYASEIDVSAKSYIVIDNNNKVLVGENIDVKREVASICKLMTTLITLEKIEAGELNLSDKFIVSNYASDAEGSQAFLDSGSEYTIEDLLKSVIVASANDSAIVLAEGIAGSEKAFVNMMNLKAKELGMCSTLYSNSTGLPAPEQYSTAYDTALLLKRVSEYELYHKYCGIWLDYLTHPSGRKTELVNTNRNIRYYEYCELGKTGFTDEAGYCLASKNTKGDFTIYSVVLGSKTSADRFTDSMKLCNYAFANFVSDKFVVSGESVANDIKVCRGKKDNVDLVANADYFVTRRVGEKEVASKVLELPDEITAKISKGDKIGEMLIVIDGVVDGAIDIVANETIEKENYHDILDKVTRKYGFVN